MGGGLGDSGVRSLLLAVVLALTAVLMGVLAFGWLVLGDGNARTALVGAFGSLVSVIVYFVHSNANGKPGSP